jgi:hypothetical protein
MHCIVSRTRETYSEQEQQVNLNTIGLPLAVAAIVLASGCTHDSYAIDPQQQLRMANEQIEDSRAVQRFAVFAAPLERKIEGLLRQEPSIESVRFAFQFGYYRSFDWSYPPDDISFSAVITAREGMTEARLTEALASAFRECGFRAYEPFGWANVDRQWACSFQSVWLQSPDPVDVSALELMLLEDEKQQTSTTTQPQQR